MMKSDRGNQMFETELKSLLGTMCGYHNEEDCTEAPEIKNLRIDESGPCQPFIGIDGSYSFLFSISGMWLGVVRACALKYEFDSGAYRLAREWLVEKPVLVSTNPAVVESQDETLRKIYEVSANSTERHREIINRLRNRMEQELALEIASENTGSVISLDGSLMDISEKLTIYPQIIAKCSQNKNILVGISKDSYTHAFCRYKTDEEHLSSITTDGCAYVRAPKKFEDDNKKSFHGDVYFAKLHPSAPKWFRIDIGTPKGGPGEVFEKIGRYSMSPVCPGYPYPMLEAHRFAVVVRQFHELYEDIILKNVRDYGLGMETALGCLTHIEGRATGAFHEYLDMVTREMR